MLLQKIDRYQWECRKLLFGYGSYLLALVSGRPRAVQLSAGAFIEQDEKILVLKLAYRDGFSLPGGRVDPGENIETALLREVCEETGCTPESYEFLFSSHSLQYAVDSIVVMFLVSITGDLRASKEGSLHWMRPEELIGKMAYTNSEAALLKYIEHKK